MVADPVVVPNYNTISEAMAAIFRGLYGHINTAATAAFLMAEEHIGDRARHVAAINHQTWPESSVFRTETLEIIFVMTAPDKIVTHSLFCPTEQFKRRDIGTEGRDGT